MAPRKVKSPKGRRTKFNSPAAKRKLTMNRLAKIRRGLNLIQVINLEHSSRQGTPLSAQQTERIRLARQVPPSPPIFEDFFREFREHLRQKEGPTGLTMVEWETLTSGPIVTSVREHRPDPVVGLLLQKCTPNEKGSFYKVLSGEKKIITQV